MRRITIAATLVAAQGAMACGSFTRGSSTPTPVRTWPTVLATARAQASDGRYDAADSTLANFATQFPGTTEALETTYWRALLNLEPNNSHGSLVTAVAGFDAYLADQRPREHLLDATAMRHVASQLEAATRVVANAMAQAKDASTSAANANARAADANARADAKTDVPASLEGEIKRLKDELAKANAELDRIRKRLSQPPGKP